MPVTVHLSWGYATLTFDTGQIANNQALNLPMGSDLEAYQNDSGPHTAGC
ncbi:MAG: hypothetical protein ABSB36_10140 [Candidatus Dormibacteria bacterium]|jgi:hypothetical protein